MSRDGSGAGDVGSSGERTFAPHVASVGDARRWVDATLTGWGADSLSWTAMLLVTELTTNAVLHASTSYTVELDYRRDGSLRIGVTDGSPRKPRRKDYGLDATTGRGLGLVGSLAAAWGTSTKPHGKTVWCDITPTPSSAADIEPDLDAFLSGDDLDMMEPGGAGGPGGAGARLTWARTA